MEKRYHAKAWIFNNGNELIFHSIICKVDKMEKLTLYEWYNFNIIPQFHFDFGGEQKILSIGQKEMEQTNRNLCNFYKLNSDVWNRNFTVETYPGVRVELKQTT